ncbi:MAG: GGDEF domain-containing protein, partial [Lachnospiraceae bacterium]|nr:GGDEF domain-containing protein [Lachnospiraceae bacterium]
IYKFSEIVDALKKNAEDNEQESVDKFIAAAKKGEREFELRLQGAIFETSSHIKFTNIRATSIYEGGELISIVGYVHQGMKGDFSPKHRLERDSFTGLLTKGEIVNAATRAIDVEKREGVTLAIIDIDHFKKVNDTFGHMVGDEIIKNVATLIEREVGDHGLVGRFGGDEFFILFYDVYDMEYCRELLRGIKSSVPTMYPVNDQNKPAVTISVGCAAYPKDADNYEDIFTLADFALYRAKEKGRNRYIIYDKAKHGTLEEIKNFKKTGKRINSRGLGSIGEVLCMLMDRVCIAKDYTAQKVLDDLVENSSYERIIVYSGTPYKAVMTAGDKVPDDKVFAETESYLMDKAYIKEYKDDILIVNNIELLESKSHSVCEKLGKQGVLSFIQIRFKDKNGVDSILSLEAVNKGIVWDEYNLHYYRLMAFLLSQFDLS